MRPRCLRETCTGLSPSEGTSQGVTIKGELLVESEKEASKKEILMDEAYNLLKKKGIGICIRKFTSSATTKEKKRKSRMPG